MSIVASLPLPAGWRRVSFARLVTRSKEAGRPDLEPLSVFLDAGVVPRASRDDNHNALGEDLGKYLVVGQGDLVFNKLRTWQGGFGHSRYTGIVSPAYFVCRTQQRDTSRFLDYLFHSRPFLAELIRVSKWQPPSQFDTPWEALRSIPCVVPPLAQQAETADFLDREGERMRRLDCRLKEAARQIDDLEQIEFERPLAEAVDTQRFRYGIRSIEQGWSPECDDRPAEDGEWGVLKLGCVKGNRFDDRQHKALPAHLAPRPALEVREGDLLMSRANTRDLVGSAAVVKTVRPRLMLSDLLYRVRLDEQIWLPTYVAAVLNSTLGRRQIERAAAGSSGSMPKISHGVVRNIALPQLTVDEQRAVMARRRGPRLQANRAVEAIGVMRDRLGEYWDALLTEAITGQLDVTKVSDAQMDEPAQATFEGELGVVG